MEYTFDHIIVIIRRIILILIPTVKLGLLIIDSILIYLLGSDTRYTQYKNSINALYKFNIILSVCTISTLFLTVLALILFVNTQSRQQSIIAPTQIDLEKIRKKNNFFIMFHSITIGFGVIEFIFVILFSKHEQLSLKKNQIILILHLIFTILLILASSFLLGVIIIIFMENRVVT